jgi:hypothetical protein
MSKIDAHHLPMYQNNLGGTFRMMGMKIAVAQNQF